jgi:AraC-like DNA-binding protein
MQLEFQYPGPEAASFVTLFYLFRSDDPVIEGVERADVGQIRFMLRGSGVLTFPGGAIEPALPAMIHGPGTGAARYRVEGPFHCFGAAMRPIGWGSLIAMPAHACADRVIDATRVFGPAAADLLTALRACDSLASMVALVEPFLLAQARPVPAEHVRLCEAVRRWLVQADDPRVPALFDAIPLSSRQVVRLVNHYFGAPPKLLERKFRALRAAAALAAGAEPRAVAEGFYDQSHMIREIRHFTGHTPGTLAARMDPVLAAALSPRAFNELSPPPQG